MDEQKYICPNCQGLVNYGSKFCPHCRYQFGEWGQPDTEVIADESSKSNNTGTKEKSGSNFWLIAVIIALICAGIYWFTKDNTEDIVSEAIKTGNMGPVFELYRKAADEDKPQTAYKIAEAAFKITLDEVNDNDNRAFLGTLYNAVYNAKNNNLHIEAGGRDEYMSPFIALIKYAYVQSELGNMKSETEHYINNYLPSVKNIDAGQLNPRDIRNMYVWIEEPFNGGYVLYGTRRIFFETFPNYRNCLGVLYLPDGEDGSTLSGDSYNIDAIRFGTTTLSWQNGRIQDVPELLLVNDYFKDLLWKNSSLQDVYKPLDVVKQDLKTMYDNLKIVKEHYIQATPNLNFDGLNFNSTEDEFYNKAPLKAQKGEGTIHATNIFANGVVVDFMPYFNYQVQDSVTVAGNFAGTFSNGVRIGDSMQVVVSKMQPYYQLSPQNEWLKYLMPNGQIFSFRFNNGILDEVNIRECPSWKN